MNEMAKAAADKGLKGLAITEHAPEMPGTCHLYYFQNLRIVPRKRFGIELLLGTELNIMNAEGKVDLSEDVLKTLDIAIASIHIPCFRDERTVENVTAAYENVMENPYVDIIGHPDDGRFPVDMKRLVSKAKKTGTLLEVNNSSLRPDCRISIRGRNLEESKFSGGTDCQSFTGKIESLYKIWQKAIDFMNLVC